MNINPQALKAIVAVLIQVASAVTDDGAQTVREWRRSQDYYIAPESPALLSALDPLILRAQAVGDRINGLRPVLDHYATEADRIITEIRRLEANPATDPQERAEQERLIAQLKAELDALEADTAAKIRALFAAALVPEKVRISEEVTKASFVLSGGGVVGGIELGQNAAFKITRFSDGTLQVTVVNGEAVNGTLDAGGVVDLGGGFTVESGSTWRLQDQGEYERFQAQLVQHIARQQWRLDPDGAGAIGAALADERYPLRPPDLRVTEMAAPFSASGSTDRIPGPDYSGHGDATFKQTVTTDYATGATTTAIDRTYGGGVGTDSAVGSGVGVTRNTEVGGTTGSTTAGVRGPDGQLSRVILTTTDRTESISKYGATAGDPGSGGKHSQKDPVTGQIVDQTTEADVRVTTTSIPITTPEERALAEQFLAEESNDPLGAFDDRDTYRPERSAPGDDFQNLAHDKGVVTNQTFHETTEPYKVEAGVDIGPEIGIEAGTETTRSEVTSNTYLEPPGPDDVRNEAPTP